MISGNIFLISGLLRLIARRYVEEEVEYRCCCACSFLASVAMDRKSVRDNATVRLSSNNDDSEMRLHKRCNLRWMDNKEDKTKDDDAEVEEEDEDNISFQTWFIFNFI